LYFRHQRKEVDLEVLHQVIIQTTNTEEEKEQGALLGKSKITKNYHKSIVLPLIS